ncbi:MAG: hypothetical protein KME16_13765 [Scytolyngbya sp. HA4215-MV1]|nr:hypothetical protein [Scytolyngbya sp. HA4215-MV1]
MAFSDYKNLAQVQQEFQIRYQEEDVVPELWIDVPALFLNEFDFNLTVMDAFSSEAARCELVIFPILREVYKRYADKAALWVQKSFTVDSTLCGTPDYMLSQKSNLGKTILASPLVLLVEAKRNDFEQGWGQCLAELVAADRLNSQSRPVYGIVTDGKLWEFGRLYNQVFTKNLASYTITDLEKLFCVLNGLFDLATQDLKVEIAP